MYDHIGVTSNGFPLKICQFVSEAWIIPITNSLSLCCLHSQTWPSENAVARPSGAQWDVQAGQWACQVPD